MAYDNRANILKQALQLFAARGYDAAGVTEIAENAGVTKPTLYHYFGSKRGVLDALLNKHFNELYRALEEAVEYHDDIPLNLNNVAAVYFDFARENPTFYRMQLSMQFAPPDSDSFRAVSEFYQKQYELIEALFKRALPHMKGRHWQYAITFMGMIDTYISLSFHGHGTLGNELRYQAVHQFMYGIFS